MNLKSGMQKIAYINYMMVVVVGELRHKFYLVCCQNTLHRITDDRKGEKEEKIGEKAGGFCILMKDINL